MLHNLSEVHSLSHYTSTYLTKHSRLSGLVIKHLLNLGVDLRNVGGTCMLDVKQTAVISANLALAVSVFAGSISVAKATVRET